ncbi:2EXR domain-containing protein [Aspergillus saccharolyticus JOP 1030-1]|uniref:2EXR domain-containing protein n=1 Tax=Aspergillus saccharolyticus JOP 1030-1 TaxID=1450539 RepID=A0A318Z438_9EURO|nr:hypothetical protein BP01DRAFT_369372 [Aspergillus saccharolyticus JOP 1030-1]PYH41087.1 hypothetical protein BP01DRAFT_369372 [Aspergillus saccharolyticus JOP 1030-1]
MAAPTSFPLFGQLPPELRQMIWAFSLPDIPAEIDKWSTICPILGDDADQLHKLLRAPRMVTLRIPGLIWVNHEARTFAQKWMQRKGYRWFPPWPRATPAGGHPKIHNDPFKPFDRDSQEFLCRCVDGPTFLHYDPISFMSPSHYELLLPAGLSPFANRAETRLAVPLALLERHPDALKMLFHHYLLLHTIVVVLPPYPAEANETTCDGWWTVKLREWGEARRLEYHRDSQLSHAEWVVQGATDIGEEECSLIEEAFKQAWDSPYFPCTESRGMNLKVTRGGKCITYWYFTP